MVYYVLFLCVIIILLIPTMSMTYIFYCIGGADFISAIKQGIDFGFGLPFRMVAKKLQK